jgi:hypothetical protein
MLCTSQSFKKGVKMKKTDEEVRKVINELEAIKTLNKDDDFSGRSGFDNPESFILKGVLLMAQQSLDPESYEKFLEAYSLLCRARHAVEFTR